MKSRTYTSLLAIGVGLGSMTSGIFFTVFNASVSKILAAVDFQGNMENLGISFLSAVIPFGAILGALVSYYSVNTIGRRHSMIIADTLILFGCIIATVPALLIMFIGRFICGIACGINLVMVPLYIDELYAIYPDKRATPMSRIMFTLGMLLVFFLAYCFDGVASGFENSWIVLFLLPMFLSFVRLLLFSKAIKYDTPAYYLTLNKETNAFIALKKICEPYEIEAAFHREREVERIKGFSALYGQQYIKQLKVTLLLTFVSQLMGMNALFFHSTVIFGSRDNQNFRNISSLPIENLWLGLTMFLVTFLGSGIIGKVRRRFSLVYGTLIITGLSFLIACSEAFDIAAWQVLLIVMYGGFQALVFGLMMGVYFEELVPLIGMSGLVIVEMVLTTITVTIVPFIGVQALFIVFGTIGALGFIPIFRQIKETQNKTEEEVMKMFNSTKESGLLDEEVMGGDNPVF